ncbi:MAG: DNA polymerase III subunit delta [Spirochaetaceae bacterium]|jgi:DNA polymerase-3 subunit delta|nr:DNA polymerase III subunit delta [Spirochaetaceae bacterium]
MAKGNCYLFLGPEIGEKQEAIKEIRKKLQEPEETSFYAGETPACDIAAFLQNGSLFASSRLVIIKNADLISKKDETALLLSYIRSPQDDTMLIVTSDEFRLGEDLDPDQKKKEPKPHPFPAANRKVFYELDEAKKIAWISAFFQQQGRSITPDGIEMLLDLVANTTDILRQECSRLIAFFDAQHKITASDLDTVFSHSRQESAFTLFSRIASGDLSRSLETLHTLLASKESPQAIFAGLSWCFRQLHQYRLLVEEGLSDNFAALRKAGFAAAAIRKDYAAALKQGYNASACLALTAEYDLLIRSHGNALESVLMDWYICILLTRCK